MKYLSKLFLLSGFVFISLAALCQPNTTIDLEKDRPKKYENRVLVSEKTGDKNFGFVRKTLQNTYSHYNYIFNANNRLNEVLNNAKLSYKDDFTKLLSFYNYTLDGTAQSQSDLDTIIYKCTASILLHDLRTNWVDDAYLILGRAYLYQKKFDSAYYVFQYINYIYAPKDDGYDIPLGSNASNTNGIFTVATDESKRSFLAKMTTNASKRNEDLLWLIRTNLEQNKTAEASGLISILKSDPNFPKRLQTDLHELIAYNFYKQKIYDSAAYHLKKSLENADGKSEQARWEFLCGQLYKLANQDSAATKMFERSIQHTVDPYLDVYAVLNIVSLTPPATKKGNPLQEHLSDVYKLAKRDKYDEFRDIIYYVAALLELKQNDKLAAKKALQKSVAYSVDNVEQKQKSFLLLADIDYSLKSYQLSYNSYDSLQISSLTPEDLALVNVKKPALKTISENIYTVHLQDSLQLLAKMSEEDRNAAVKRIYKQLRKEQGAKESDIDYGSLAVNTPAPTNLFGAKVASSDFYFVNANLKSQGFRDFKAQWGNRPNVDNWQRQAVITRNTPVTTNLAMVDIDQIQPDLVSATITKDISIESLLLNIPLNETKIDSSNIKIYQALFTTGVTFQNQLEDYQAAKAAYEELLRRFPNTKYSQIALFNLYYCYTKLGFPKKADSVKSVLNKNYSDGTYTDILNNGNKANEAATKRYENIYNLFIEGRFEEARVEKLKADNQYGKTYWTPQMLYIEALYHVKQKQDSIAINKLQTLISTFPTSPLVDKSTTMIDVLKRRKEIEAYLTNLQVEQKQDSLVKRVDITAPAIADASTGNLKIDSVTKLAPALTAIAKPADTKPNIITKNGYSFNDQEKHYTIVILDKVDDVFINEARNTFNRFNKEKFYNDKIDISTTKLDDRYTLLLLGPFNTANDAINYVDRTKPFAASRIVSWLPVNKYSFSIISSNNLDVLKTGKNVDEYKQFIKQFYPDKF
jgi:outer membrane protein assembly factor BamD (BamD/ComL family)